MKKSIVIIHAHKHQTSTTYLNQSCFRVRQPYTLTTYSTRSAFALEFSGVKWCWWVVANLVENASKSYTKQQQYKRPWIPRSRGTGVRLMQVKVTYPEGSAQLALITVRTPCMRYLWCAGFITAHLHWFDGPCAHMISWANLCSLAVCDLPTLSSPRLWQEV